MLWSAPLIFLIQQKNIFNKYISIFPLLLIFISSILTATRSWILVSLFYFVIIIYIYIKDTNRPATKMARICFSIALIIFSGSLLFIFFEPQIQSGSNILSSRVFTDTRTWQLQQFFSDVSLHDLLYGTGPRGTWRMGYREYGYVDGVYFFLLFLGGAPLLLSYLYLTTYPAIRITFSKYAFKLRPIFFSCTILVLMWCVVLSGIGTYTIPELKVNHYIVLLCAGQCWRMFYENRFESN
jgi:hypothetical protein